MTTRYVASDNYNCTRIYALLILQNEKDYNIQDQLMEDIINLTGQTHANLYITHMSCFFFNFYFFDRKRNFIRREWNVQKRMRHPHIDTKDMAKA